MIYYITNQTKIPGTFNFPVVKLDHLFDYFEDKEIIAVDSETKGFDPHMIDVLLLFQLGDENRQYVIDITTVDISPLKELLEDRMILLHNAKFDLRFMFKYGIVPFGNIWDTFLAEKVLSNGIYNHRCSLDACTRRYLKISLKKEVRGLIHRLGPYNERVIRYAAEDVEHLHALREHQLRILQEKKLMNCINLENNFVTVLAYTEYCGIHLNREMWLQKSKKDKEKMLNMEKQLNVAVENLGEPKFLKQPDLFNPNYSCNILWSSPKQVIPLMKHLGVNVNTVDKKTGKAKESVESTVLEKQKEKHALVPLYMKYREYAKLVTTYGESFLNHINPNTGRVHTNYNQLMNTGRLSSGSDKENARNKSVNMQNIPAGYDEERVYFPAQKEDYVSPERVCFTAQDGFKLICGDYSGQESRILADISGEPRLLEFYASGEADLHSYAARLVFPEIPDDMPLKEVKGKFKKQRQTAKSFNFALAYGGNANTVARNLNIPIEEAREAENRYFAAFHGLGMYFEDVKRQTIKDGYVLIDNITGRKFFFHNLEELKEYRQQLEDYVSDPDYSSHFQGLSSGFWSYRSHLKANDPDMFSTVNEIMKNYFRIKGVMEREGLNYRIQGTGASQTKYAGVLFFREILNKNSFGVVRIVNMVHDEINVEAPEYMADNVAVTLKQCLERGGNMFTTRIEMKADVKIADYWTH